MEGGDSGWRVGYQHPPLGKERVPWKSEQTWVCFGSSQERYNGVSNPNPNTDLGVRSAAYLPPVTNIGDGPSGFLFDPGTGISPAFRHHFFLCHSKGSYAKSEIHAFTLKEKGATFELGESKPFVRFTHSPDLDIAPDGSIYFLDWSETMSKTAKGRIYRMYDPAVLEDPKTLETKRYIEEGMDKRDAKELSLLLGHEDRRVRMEAQFELVKRKEADILKQTASTKGNLLARLHGIWGLGQLGRKEASQCAPLASLLDDSESEVRAQAAKMIGDIRLNGAATQLIAKLKDDNTRVRYFAAMALGKLKATDAAPAIVAMLRANDNKDPYLRHAGVMSLVGMSLKTDGFWPDPKSSDYLKLNENVLSVIADADNKESEAIELVRALVTRRLPDNPGHNQLGALVHSSRNRVRVEALRAISEEHVAEDPLLFEAIGSGLRDEFHPADPILRVCNERIVYCLWLSGTEKDAGELADVAANQNLALPNRFDALTYLGDWAATRQRNRFTGLTQSIADRGTEPAIQALQKSWDRLLDAGSPIEVKLASIEAAQKLKAKSLAPKLAALIGDAKQASNVRSAAMLVIGDWDDQAAIESAVKAAQDSHDSTLRRASLRLLPHSTPATAVALLEQTFKDAKPDETAEALGVLSLVKGDKAEEMLNDWLGRLSTGKVEPLLQLEVIEAAKANASPAIQSKLKAYLDSLPKARTTAAFPFLQEGGDPVAGKKVFFEHTAAQCMRCHKIGGKGSEVGPILDGIGKRQPRDYILESILFPSNKIAQGFELVMVTTKDGKSHGGMVRKETSAELQLSPPVPNAPVEIIAKSEITARTPGVSAMPEMFQQVLTHREIRDLAAYLAGLKK